MISLNEWVVFVMACAVVSLTPGPNMLYLTSRAICQGRAAAFVSLLGVVSGFVLHITLAATGLTALLNTVPLAYDVVRYLGAAYLLWMAWNAVKPGGVAAFQAQSLPDVSRRRLFVMGFMTNALNPQAAMFYLSIFSQFIHPERGSIFGQSLLLGGTQMTISFFVNLGVILVASSLSGWFAARPYGLRLQRALMGSVLAGLALRLALSGRR